MSSIFASFVITSAICFGIFRFMMWHFRRRHLYKLASKFDGPPVLPFIGNAHLLIGNIDLYLSKISRLYQLYPAPFRLWVGSRLFVLVLDPAHVKTVCVSPKTLEKSEILNIAQPLVGAGLLTGPVSIWKRHRRLIQPTFNQRILDSFVEVFTAQSKILTKNMERHLDGPEFEIRDMLLACIMDMLCETAMGVNMGAQSNNNHYYIEAVTKVFYSLSKRIVDFSLRSDSVFYRTQLGKDQRKHIKYLHDFSDNVIKMKRDEFANSSSQPGTADSENDERDVPLRGKAFLDHLMKLSDDGVQLSNQELRDEVHTMLLAGTDTSLVVNSFMMLMLAYHPDIQEKVYRELYEIYGGKDIEEHPITPKDLPRMKYMERVMKETIRLFPVAPYLARAVTDDLEIGDHILPKGSSVVFSIIDMHRDERYWPDPFRFDPNRFLPEEIAKRIPYSYMGFSDGPRNCLGSNHAIMSAKTLFATVLRRYILKSDNIVPLEDIQLKFRILLKPMDPIKIRIERRTKN